MYNPLKIDNDQMVLRPMTCPHHMLVYKAKPRSYRDLPFSLAEKAILHRYEASGALIGLERVRCMQLIDTHNIVRSDQIVSEIRRLYDIIIEVLNVFKIKIHRIDLSLHDPKNKQKYFDNPEL
jgi:threonyl-tRNA synthetase